MPYIRILKQEPAQRFRHIMITIVKQNGASAVQIPYEIKAFNEKPSGTKVTDHSFDPRTIKRLSDSIEFSIGDRVSNGDDSPMCGKILSFSLLEEEIYVTTTYSGVGMNLGSLQKVAETPSRFQRGDAVSVKFSNLSIPKAVVIAVHHGIADKIKYDLQVWIDKSTSTRIYGVDGTIVEQP